MAATSEQVEQAQAQWVKGNAVSGWLRQAYWELCDRDCVDALKDADSLARMMQERCDAILGRTA